MVSSNTHNWPVMNYMAKKVMKTEIPNSLKSNNDTTSFLLQKKYPMLHREKGWERGMIVCVHWVPFIYFSFFNHWIPLAHRQNNTLPLLLGKPQISRKSFNWEKTRRSLPPKLANLWRVIAFFPVRHVLSSGPVSVCATHSAANSSGCQDSTVLIGRNSLTILVISL